MRKASTPKTKTTHTTPTSKLIKGEDYSLATGGDTRAQARVMMHALASLASLPAPMGEPIIARLWKVYCGTATERRRNFLCTIDFYAGHTPLDHLSGDLRSLVAAWLEEPKAGPRKSAKTKNVWQLIANRWKVIEGEDVPWSRWKKIWSDWKGHKYVRRAEGHHVPSWARQLSARTGQ